MEKKIVTTLNLYRCLGLICGDCPLKGQGMNQKQFCSFYKKSHDSARPAFCKVENIEIIEGLELPEPREMNRPEISSLEVHEICHQLLYARGIHGEIHVEVERDLTAWLVRKGIKMRK